MRNFANYTTKAEGAIRNAVQIAASYSHQAITPLHLILALFRQEGGLVPTILKRMEHDQKGIEGRVVDVLEYLPKVTGAGTPYLSPTAEKALKIAEGSAAHLKDTYVSTEHLFLGLVETPDAKKVLNVTREDILRTLETVRGSAKVTDPEPEAKYQALEKYTVDLTRLAKSGKVDPVVGRDDEIRRVIRKEMLWRWNSTVLDN